MGIFSDDSSSDTCTPLDFTESQPIAGDWRLHKLFSVISGVLAILTVLISLGLTFTHLINFSIPPLQRQLIRAILMPGVYALFAWIAVLSYDAARFITPIGDLYEVFALVAIFYYMNLVIMPDDTRRHNIRSGDLSYLIEVLPNVSLQTYAKSWFAVFQILPGRLILTIAQWIIAGAFCQTSKKYRTGNTVINVLNGIQTTVCIFAILRFYKLAKPQLQSHKIVLKLIAFKIPIFLQVLQKAIFSGLNSHNDLHLTNVVSQADWYYGVPGFMTVSEMFLFVWLFIPAFTWTPFTSRNVGTVYNSKASFGRGVFEVLNVSDIIGGIGFTLRLWSASQTLRGPGETQDLPEYSSRYNGQPPYDMDEQYVERKDARRERRRRGDRRY